MSLQYSDTLDYLYSLTGLGIKPGLHSIKGLLRILGNPERTLPAIHIAGTNGKGSTAAMIESVLREAGYKTGLYTSPHLVRFNERIRLGAEEISDEDLLSLAAVVLGARERLKEQSGLEATFFEVTTAMALLYFKEQEAEVVILETGLGGALDATNVLTPLVSIITNVDIDHKAFLGESLDKIAAEKAGIIKKGVPLISGLLDGKAADVINKKSLEVTGVLPERLGHEFTAEGIFKGRFNYRGPSISLNDLELGLCGAFQLKNAALAIAALEVLCGVYPAINEAVIREGLRSVKWPARFEFISSKPPVVLDCAHNPAGASALAAAIRDFFPLPRAITLVIGLSEDKDLKGVLTPLLPLARRVIFTEAAIERAAPAALLQERAGELREDCECEPTVPNAITSALNGLRTGEILLIAGSVFVAGEVRVFFARQQEAARKAVG